MIQTFPITEKNQDLNINDIVINLEKGRLDRIINIEYEYDIITRQNIQYIETYLSSPFCLLKFQVRKVGMLLLDNTLANLN